MEELQKRLIAEIEKELSSADKDVELLDVLSSLLSTVTSYTLRKEEYIRN